MIEYEFFSQDPAWWGNALQSIWGCHDICPLLRSFHTTSIIQSELSSLTSLKAWVTQRNSRVKLPSSSSWLEDVQRETRCLASLPNGYTHTKPGYPPWGRQLNCWSSYPPLGLTVPMPLCSVMGTPAMCHSPREGQLSVQVVKGTGSTACRRVNQL